MNRLIPFALALVLAAPATVLAQEDGDQDYERGQLIQVSTWDVDPADAEKWESAVKQIAEAAGKADIGYRWAFWQDGSRYTLIYPVDAFAYFDDPTQFVRAFAGTAGEAQMQAAMATFSEIDAQTVAEEMAEMKQDWSYMVDSFDMGTMTNGHFDVMWIKPGMNEEFDQLNKEWSAFFKDLGYPYPYHGHQVHFGDTGRAVYVTFIDNMSDYYGKNGLMNLVEAKNMGERWQGLLEQFNSVVRRWAHHNETFRRDLSYWPLDEDATN